MSEWPIVPLGDVAEIQLGKMLSPKAKGGHRPIQYLRNANVQWDRFDLDDIAQMDFSEAEERKFQIRSGDVLVVEGGEPGRAAVWDAAIERICYQKAVHRVRPHPARLDPHFLVYRLWAGAFRGEFTSGETKTTIAHLPRIRLLRLPVPLPPLDEQRRIAARLRAQLAEVESVRSELGTRCSAAGNLLVALLRRTFSAADKRPKTQLRHVIRPRSDVVHPRDKPTGLARFVGLEHVEPQTGRRIGQEPLNLATMTGRKARFFPGDIVYGYLRPYLNKVWIAEFDGFCSVDQYVFVVEPEVADVEYVVWYLRSPAYLAAAPIDETPGQLPRIRLDEVLSTPIPLPPLDEQRRIAARLREQLDEINRARAALEAQRAAAEALPAALLREVFDPPVA